MKKTFLLVPTKFAGWNYLILECCPFLINVNSSPCHILLRFVCSSVLVRPNPNYMSILSLHIRPSVSCVCCCCRHFNMSEYLPAAGTGRVNKCQISLTGTPLKMWPRKTFPKCCTLLICLRIFYLFLICDGNPRRRRRWDIYWPEALLMSDKNNDGININNERIHLEIDSPPRRRRRIRLPDPPPIPCPGIYILFHRYYLYPSDRIESVSLLRLRVHFVELPLLDEECLTGCNR